MALIHTDLKAVPFIVIQNTGRINNGKRWIPPLAQYENSSIPTALPTFYSPSTPTAANSRIWNQRADE